jgi:hypothetical protein
MALAGAALAAVGTYFLLRWLKGSITISLPGTYFSPGGSIEGSFELLTRKEVRANSLTAALVGTESVRERGYNGKSRTRTREIYRAGQTLEQAKEYPAGYSAVYQFKLAAPAAGGQGEGGSLLGQALDMLGSIGRTVRWKVEVRLDAEGVDLASSETVHINGQF